MNLNLDCHVIQADLSYLSDTLRAKTEDPAESAPREVEPVNAYLPQTSVREPSIVHEQSAQQTLVLSAASVLKYVSSMFDQPKR